MIIIIGIACIILYLLIDWLAHLPKIDNCKNRYIFVTGCDSGFGRDLALKLDALGFPVFAGCLTQDGQNYVLQNASNRLVPLSVDVTDTTSIESAMNFVKDKLPTDSALWAVVNNAGLTGRVCHSEMCTRQDYIQACEVNLFGPIEVARVFMPLLRKSQGRVINMVSVMGRCPAVTGPYSVSKFGMEAFTDVLRREVSDFGIKVVAIEPGFFKTTIFNIQNFDKNLRTGFEKCSDEVKNAYGKDYVEKSTCINQGLFTMLNKDTYKVVNAYIHAITAKYPRARYLVGNDAKYYFVPLYHLPEWLMDWIFKKNNEKLYQIGKDILRK